jgi:2-oxoglutarate/2-oxoacid ferredoxin oxidoreductase subunit beta
MIKGEKFLNPDRLPTIWCPGCGNGIVLHAAMETLEEMGCTKKDVVCISGIGCSSRSGTYTQFDQVHTLHGRAIPFATAIKLARPDKKIIVFTGDGDASAIGGNHLIHAARRNIDITVVVFNNSIYGMTGGQVSPLTAPNKKGTTARFGNFENQFDLVKLCIGAGATYVARTGTYFYRNMKKYMTKGFSRKGFSLIEIITQCPVYYGRLNGTPDAYKMMLQQKELLLLQSKYDALSEEEKTSYLPMGEFIEDNQQMSYIEKREQLLKKVRES